MDIEKFWNTVEKRGPKECWPWKGAVSGCGYGSLMMDGKYLRPHRVAYQHGRRVALGRWIVRHRCDNKICCNPNHLVRGTHKQNTSDAISRKLHSPPPVLLGEDHGRAKLTWQRVREIREAARSGTSIYRIAKCMGIPETTVGHVVHGRTWVEKQTSL